MARPCLCRHSCRRPQGGGGDIVQPLANDTIDEDDVIGDLFELARGQQAGRLPGDTTSITLFKSVGAALEDLAAAELAIEA